MMERSRDSRPGRQIDEPPIAESGNNMANTTSRQTLLHLSTGQSCRIQAVAGSGVMRRRLMDLGVFPSAEITLLRVAPLNDPIEIRVEHSFVSLRRSEAVLIEVVAA